MTGNTSPVSSRNSAWEHYLHEVHTYMHAHVLKKDMHSHKISEENGLRTYLQIKKWQYLPARAAIICSGVGSG